MESRPLIDLTVTTLPREVQAIRDAISAALAAPDPQQVGLSIGQAKAGVYAFFDYEDEPIYVGQTAEGFAVRLGRHLTGQRSDAVAKYVLDPFEVRTVAMWSLPHINELPAGQRKGALDRYEYAVLQLLMARSVYGAVLNEGDIPSCDPPELPEPVYRAIIPDDILAERSHPDVRIARRAQTIASLAKNISERRVSKGLRRTLVLQAQRLEDLASRRYESLAGPVELEGAEGVVPEPEP